MLITLYRLIGLTVLISLCSHANAQNDEGIVTILKKINAGVAGKNCTGKNAMVISNRAMNIFLADKTGYLSTFNDLSYYTNYVTLNSTSGLLTINHNFQKAEGFDEPLKALFNVGVKANIADGFNSNFLDKRYKNSLGVTVNKTWIGKTKTHLAGCSQNNQPELTNNASINQKQAMDALRAGILHQLEIEINNRITEFKNAINSIDSTQEIPGQNLQAARALVQKDFYNELYEEYQEKFARLQAEALTRTNYYTTITSHWTSLSSYIPLSFPTYQVASSLSSAINKKHPYPLQINLNHTRLWQSSKTGKLFITLSGSVQFNNSVNGFLTAQVTKSRYKNLGGTDTITLASLKTDEINIGTYKNFVTPALYARVVYFPGASHVGISFSAEKSFGDYNLLNGQLGIPVILINSKKLPAINIEFQVQFFDMSHSISSDRKLGNKKAIGVGIGVPLSRLMY